MAGIYAARDWGVELFISCHANSLTNTPATGSEALYKNVPLSTSLAPKLAATMASTIGISNRGALNLDIEAAPEDKAECK